MIRASIDIGTNSVRLLIAEIYDNNMKLKTLLKQVDIVRLGEGVDKNKNLNLKAIDRCINKLKEYKKIINSFEVDNINIIATSAVRDAQNREIFARRFKYWRRKH
ncbi:hypothetical protein HY745_10155 [Candidatus Desantisbacteria bacterium]|nr:hypothetical protein [Candidatus Desantisbacteria bacterium]